MGKSTINGVFSIATLNYQRVVSINIPLNHYKIPLKHYKIPLNPISTHQNLVLKARHSGTTAGMEPGDDQKSRFTELKNGDFL